MKTSVLVTGTVAAHIGVEAEMETADWVPSEATSSSVHDIDASAQRFIGQTEVVSGDTKGINENAGLLASK